MDRDTFAAKRSEQLSAADDRMRPIVRRALEAYPQEGWEDEVIEEAAALWLATFQDETEATPAELREFRSSLRKALAKTTSQGAKGEAEPHQVERITKWLGTYTVNSATRAGANSAGIGQQRWVTMHDEDVRPMHREADGQTVPIGAPFSIGGFKLHYPGEPVGPPEVWINCRCMLQPVGKGENMSDTSTSFIEAILGEDGPEAVIPLVAAASGAVEDQPEIVEEEKPEGGDRFNGVAAPTGVETGDKRMFAEGGLTWRPLPLPLQYQKDTAHGGTPGGAVTVGVIDKIWYDGSLVRYSGTWSSVAPEVEQLKTGISEGSVRGVSVDVDDVVVAAPEPHEGDYESEQEFLEDLMNPPATVFKEARIAGITIVAIPAFHEAYIALGDFVETAEAPEETEEQKELVASGQGRMFALVASAAPKANPPAMWFENPRLKRPTPLTITDDGRVFGHLAAWATCHIGVPGMCKTPPHSMTNYERFRLGAVYTAEGTVVPVGHITMGIGHAPVKPGLSSNAAAAHYDNTEAVVADVAAGEDAHGIWIAGALRDGVSEAAVRTLRSASLSGDWRMYNGNLELVAALAVNVPGFPIPRTPALVASGGMQTALVAAGIVERSVSNEMTDEELSGFVAAVADEVERRQEHRAQRQTRLAAIRQSEAEKTRQERRAARIAEAKSLLEIDE